MKPWKKVRLLSHCFEFEFEVEWRDCCSLHAVISITVHTHGKMLSICSFIQ